MVSGIGSANYVNQVTSDYFYIQNNNAEGSSYNELVDEYIPSNDTPFRELYTVYLELDKSKISSFEDFVVERNRAVTGIENDTSYIEGIDYEAEYQEYLTVTRNSQVNEYQSEDPLYGLFSVYEKLDKRAISSFEDFVVERNKAVTGIENDTSYIEGIDYEGEFQEYLKINGCENEEELKYFAEVTMDTQGRLERAVLPIAKGKIMYTLAQMQIRNPLSNIDIMGMTEALMKNSSFEDLQEFSNNTILLSSNPQERVNAFRDLVSKENNSGSGYPYSDLLLTIDIFEQQLEDEQAAKEAVERNGGTYTIDYNQYMEQALEQYRRFA